MKRILVPVSVTALGVAAAVSMGFAQDGTGGNSGVPTVTPTLSAPSGADAPIANLLALTTVGGTNGTLMNATSGAVVINIPGIFSNASGLSNLPGSAVFSMTGGMGSGGDLTHFLANGSIITVGTSGFSSVPGCEWIGSTLFGSAAFSTIGDTLITLDPFTGAGTQVGTGYGGGVGGLDSLALDPTSGVLYGDTGFFYDGTPGDVITIDPSTGVGTDTGVDKFDSSGFGPSCTVAGMSIDLSGEGWLGIGCGVGDVYSWDVSTNVIVFIGNNGLGGSSNGVAAIF